MKCSGQNQVIEFEFEKRVARFLKITLVSISHFPICQVKTRKQHVTIALRINLCVTNLVEALQDRQNILLLLDL